MQLYLRNTLLMIPYVGLITIFDCITTRTLFRLLYGSLALLFQSTLSAIHACIVHTGYLQGGILLSDSMKSTCESLEVIVIQHIFWLKK